jgi:hypothetical protein
MEEWNTGMLENWNDGMMDRTGRQLPPFILEFAKSPKTSHCERSEAIPTLATS